MMADNFIAIISFISVIAYTNAFLKLSIDAFSYILAFWSKVISVTFTSAIYVLAAFITLKNL